MMIGARRRGRARRSRARRERRLAAAPARDTPSVAFLRAAREWLSSHVRARPTSHARRRSRMRTVLAVARSRPAALRRPHSRVARRAPREARSTRSPCRSRTWRWRRRRRRDPRAELRARRSMNASTWTARCATPIRFTWRCSRSCSWPTASRRGVRIDDDVLPPRTGTHERGHLGVRSLFPGRTVPERETLWEPPRRISGRSRGRSRRLPDGASSIDAATAPRVPRSGRRGVGAQAPELMPRPRV